MKKYLFLLAAAAAVSACSNEDEQYSAPIGGQEITFSIEVPGGTRAANTNVWKADDEKFFVWADQVELVNGVNKLYDGFINAWNLKTATQSSKLTHVGSDSYQWPAVNKLRFYAIHGNFSGTNSTIVANTSPFPKPSLTDEEAAVAANLKPLTHTVPTIQTNNEEGNYNYCYADLMYAVVPTTGIVQPVPLHFYHLMSKIVIKIVKGQGITLAELNNATVEIVQVKNKVEFLPKKLKLQTTGEATDSLVNDASELTTYATRCAKLSGMLTLPEQLLVDITVANSTTMNANASVSGTNTEAAIIVPQEFAAGNTAAGIKITWSGKTILVPFAGATTPFTFECGKVYTYTITLDHVGTSYGFTPTVTAWGDEEQRPIDVTSGS